MGDVFAEIPSFDVQMPPTTNNSVSKNRLFMFVCNLKNKIDRRN